MKVKFSRPILLDAVGTAMYSVSSKNTISAVECILINCEEDKVIISSYDLEKGMRIEIDAEVEETGSCLINAQSFYSIIKLMPAGIIELASSDTWRTKISSGNSEFELNGLNPSDFPTLPDIENENSFTIKQGDMKNMIAQTLFAVAQNDARPTFNGAYFKMKGNHITTVGCDGFRLAIREKICELQNANEDLDVSFIIPGRTLNEILKLLNEPEETVNIILNRKQVLFRFEEKNITFFSRLIEGEYIDYDRIIPKNSTIFVDVDTDIFASAVERAALVTDDSSGKNKSLARCFFHDNKLEITSVSVNGKVRDEISTSQTGADIEIGFNCRYLTDALKASMCDKLHLSLSSPYISMVIEPLENDEKDHFIFLVLPCKMK